MRHVSDDERRARLAVRHALALASRVSSPDAVVRAMTVLHATEPATVCLSYWARSRAPEVTRLNQAFRLERSLVKQLAMRRTLFVFPQDLLAAAWGSASARIAEVQRSQLIRDLVRAGVATDGEGWIERVRAQVLAVLAEQPDGLTTRELRLRAPLLSVKIAVPNGEPWSASRVLTYLGACADIVRVASVDPWHTGLLRWALPQHWLSDEPKPWSAADGYRELVRRWLRTFGPGTEEDLVWWLGATRKVVRTTLAELSAVEVSLDNGMIGWLLPDDLAKAPNPGSWVALLPVLDPTVMGWHNRHFYLGRHRENLFDNRGNAGTTVWVDGRVVGCWIQDKTGDVQIRLLEEVSAHARRALAAEALRLTVWLKCTRIPTVLRSPAMIG